MIEKGRKSVEKTDEGKSRTMKMKVARMISTSNGGSIQDERCKCCQHEHEEDATYHAIKEVVLAKLAKHQKPTPNHALVANDTNNVVIEKEVATIQVMKPINNALAPIFEPMSMFESDYDEDLF